MLEFYISSGFLNNDSLVKFINKIIIFVQL